MKYYIACNTLAVTNPMSKKAALNLWERVSKPGLEPGAKYQLCEETGNMYTFTPVMDLN